MKNLEDYQKRRDALAAAYDRILASTLLPVRETTEEAVRKRKQNLVEGHFYLAVCGQINSGKSTLLNALIFGAEILPMDIMALTAKNTLLRYADKPGLKVEFMSIPDWERLVADLKAEDKKNPGTWRNFRKEMNESHSRYGILKDECVRDSSMERIDEMENLPHYVTPVGESTPGRWTPFVKQVTLFYPHPWLRDVTVVDTPGVNDPLKYREDVTQKWVNQADAVVFVCYAGQAMSADDIDFMNTYLLHVSPERRVVAINKRDVLDGGEDVVRRWIDSLRSDPSPQISQAFGDEKTIVFVSAAGALLSSLEKCGKVASPSLAAGRDRLSTRGCLDPDGHNMGRLRELVEQRLLRKGADGLREHQYFLRALLKQKDAVVRQSLLKVEDDLRLLNLSDAELQREKTAVERESESLSNLVKLMKRKFNDSWGKANNLLLASAWSYAAAVAKKIDVELSKCSSLCAMTDEWIILDVLRPNVGKMFGEARSTLDELENTLKNHVNDFANEISSDLKRQIPYALSINLYDCAAKIRKILEESIGQDLVEKWGNDATSWWQRFWNMQAGLDKARLYIIRRLQTMINKTFEAGMTSVGLAVEKCVDDLHGSVGMDVQSILKDRQKTLVDLLSKRVVYQEKRVQSEKLRQAAYNDLASLEALTAELEFALQEAV